MCLQHLALFTTVMAVIGFYLRLSVFLHNEPIYFVVKRSRVKVTSHKNINVVGICTLVRAGFFWFVVFL